MRAHSDQIRRADRNCAATARGAIGRHLVANRIGRLHAPAPPATARLKWDINPRLQFTTAVYDLGRTNQRLPDPNNPGFFFLSGSTKARGLEVALAGYLSESWQVLGGYAYTDAHIVGATSATILPGNRVGLVPYNTFTLWNKYQFTDWFAAGAGIIHQADSFAASDDTVRLPGFTRVDAGIYGTHVLWTKQILRWQITMENVFGVRYYSMADGNNNITPGSPRAVRGSVTISF
jgi:catecholate siderophore receptor